MAIMASKWAGKCRQCRQGYAQGAEIFWSKATGAICLACHGQEPPRKGETAPKVDAPTKGALDGKLLRRWDSWSEYVDTVAALPDRNRRVESGKRGHDYASNFYGYDTLYEAISHARDGWDEPRKEIDALTENISDHIAPITKPAFTSYFDVSGGMVDVGRFLDGEPECMVETKLVEIAKPGRVISILINGCYSAGIADKDIRTRGAAVVGLIDALERCQYSTEVWLEISHKTISYLVKVKDASEALDIDILMFAIGNKACFRHLNFSLQDLEESNLRVGKAHSYGYVSNLSCAELVNANVCLEFMRYGSEEANAEVWIKNKLSEFGLLAGEE